MPRRYKTDENGETRPTYYGKLPEEFTEADTMRFIADTDRLLSRKENSKMSDEKYIDAQAPAQEAEQTPAFKLDVNVRIIEPMKNLVGFATVKFNDCFVVEDFKILTGEKGLYIGMPSKPDRTSKTGYRDTARPVTAEFRGEIQSAILDAYGLAVEKLQARANAVQQTPEKQSIKEQLENGAKQAVKDNAARPPKEKPTKAAER